MLQRGPGIDPGIEAIIEQGDPARLIPVGADGATERRITSVFLSVMMSVDEFGKSILRIVGAPSSKTARITCFSEVKFKQGTELDRAQRPDGLIFVRSGSRIWSAIVEAKVGGAELTTEQVEAYLDIAKANKVQAVITISNQFAPLPTHYPIKVNRRKLKAVDLYHCSWTSVLSEAVLMARRKEVADADQAYILDEFIRYLRHDSSGVHPFPKLGTGWKEVCANVQNSVPLSKSAPAVVDAVAEWHQLVSFLSLQLGMSVNRNVSIHMGRAHAKDSAKRLQDGIVRLTETNRLEAKFEIPDAAAHLEVCADLKGRTLSAGMMLRAPKDRSRSTALVTWLLRQLTKVDDENLLIRAVWPGRTAHTGKTLGELRLDPKAILKSNLSILPVAFEVVRVKDIGARFRGAKTFVEEIDALLPAFYGDVGQHLQAWVPRPPRVDNSLKEDLVDEIMPQLADGVGTIQSG